MRSGRARILAPYLLVSLAMMAPDAWAYLDPSTGSMILSAIVGMFATAALAFKTYWYKLKGLFRRRQHPCGDPDDGRGDKRPGQDTKPASD